MPVAFDDIQQSFDSTLTSKTIMFRGECLRRRMHPNECYNSSSKQFGSSKKEATMLKLAPSNKSVLKGKSVPSVQLRISNHKIIIPVHSSTSAQETLLETPLACRLTATLSTAIGMITA